jgi:diguanylate cyclase (GGDEF)-like protein/PAS domain S-box-containing protein
MSQVLEAVAERPKVGGPPDPIDIGQAQFEVAEVTHLCNHAALEMVTQSIVFFSAPASRLVHVNRAACHRLGFTQQQLRGMSLSEIAPQATPANLTDLYFHAMRSPNQEARVRTVYRHRSGSLVPVRCFIRALPMLPENVLVAVGQDLPGSRNLKRRRFIAAFRDSLTLLPNRVWLWRQLEHEIRVAGRSDYRFAVLVVDIDRFKDINDSFGHLAGDHVLQAVARRLTASVRPNDAVTRFGGDEFVVLLKDIHGDEDISRVTERIGRCLEAAGRRGEGSEWRAQVTVSIGVAICEGQGCTSVDLFERADQAMYRAKALGRNGRFVIDESPKNSGQSAGVRAECSDRTRQFG